MTSFHNSLISDVATVMISLGKGAVFSPALVLPGYFEVWRITIVEPSAFKQVD